MSIGGGWGGGCSENPPKCLTPTRDVYVDKICLSWRKIVHELQSPSAAKFSILENLNVYMNIFPAHPT